MRTCAYCGQQNQEDSVSCEGCGTALALNESETGQPAAPAPKRPLTARFATVLLLAFLGAQLAVGMLVGMVGASFAQASGGNLRDQAERAQFQRSIAGPASVLAYLGGGLTLWLVSRSMAPQHRVDTAPTGAAWITGSFKHIAQGLGAGVLTGSSYLALAAAFGRPGDEGQLGPLARMAFAPGVQQWLWLVLILLLAPVIEEPLFRGLLYGGYRRSFGSVRAALLTTVIFWLLHLTEMIYFWPSMVGVAALAVVALWFRLYSSAIGPAVAVHFGYNAVLALIVVADTLR